MFLRRLIWMLAISAVVAVPEALIQHSDPQVGFQVWMVLQLLGVIAAAIFVAATFSSVGLALVKVATRPWRSSASVFVAWSFLKAARPGAPAVDRMLRRLSRELDGSANAVPKALVLKRLVVGGGLGLMTFAALWLRPVAPSGWWIVVRNAACAGLIHAALLICAASPWRLLRLAPLYLTVLASALAVMLVAPTWLLGAPMALTLGVIAWLSWALSRRQRRVRRQLGARWGVAATAYGAAVLTVGLLAQQPFVWAAGVVALTAAAYWLLSSQPKVTLPVYVSIVGVASGTWALIVVLSVMGGFAEDLRSKMLVANAHALIERDGRSRALTQARALSRQLRAVEGVASVSPQVRGDALISSPFHNHNFVSVRGVDPRLSEVARQVGATVVTGSLTLLARPEELLPVGGMRRVRPEARELDVPTTPTASVTETVDDGDDLGEQDVDALLRLAPGPAAPRLPTPSPIILDSEGEHLEEPEPSRPSAAVSPTGDHDGGHVGALAVLADVPPLDIPVAPGVLLGVELANALQVELGDRVELITPDADIGPTGLRPRLWTFRVAGTFQTGLYEVDSKVAYVDLEVASRYFNLDGGANVIELRLSSPRQPDEALQRVKAVTAQFDDKVDVLDWRSLNKSLFSALAFERLVIFLVLALIILVASFSIVSALTMVILQKRSGISMLRAMGAQKGTVKRAFVQMGGVIGMIGTTAGLCLGVATCLLVDALGIQLPEAYYVRTLPVAINPFEVGVVVAASMAISLIATVFPANGASRSPLLEGLRHE